MLLAAIFLCSALILDPGIAWARDSGGDDGDADSLAQPYENDRLLQTSTPIVFEIQAEQNYGVVEMVSRVGGGLTLLLVVVGLYRNDVRARDTLKVKIR